MKEKIVDFGTKHNVIIDSADDLIIMAIAPEIKEGFVLLYHNIKVLPNKGDKGTIIFERDNNKGHWQFYPEEK